MGKTHFSGPVVTGQDNGVPAQNTQGTLVAAQRVTVSSTTSGASSIVLPGCALIGGSLAVRVGTSGATMTVRVGATANDARFFAIDSSAAGFYRLGAIGNEANASAAAMETVTGPQRLFVDVTAAGSGAGVSSFDAILTVEYVQR